MTSKARLPNLRTVSIRPEKNKFAFYLVLFYLLVERVNSMSQSNLLRFIMCLGFLNLYLKVLNKMVIE